MSPGRLDARVVTCVPPCQEKKSVSWPALGEGTNGLLRLARMAWRVARVECDWGAGGNVETAAVIRNSALDRCLRPGRAVHRGTNRGTMF